MSCDPFDIEVAPDMSVPARDRVAIAFADAVKSAQYGWGHNGATGTIAEKNTFVMAGPARKATKTRPAETLEQRVSRLKYDNFQDDPALCIRLENGSFRFFGWARS